jgi:hypothetical protein
MGKPHFILRYEAITWIGITEGNLPDSRWVASKKNKVGFNNYLKHLDL